MAKKTPKKLAATGRATRRQALEAPQKARRIVTCAALARELDVARSTVTRAAKPGGPLAPAVTDDGRIDLDDPAAIEWISDREDSDEEPIHDPQVSEPMSLDEMEKLTLAEITERFGHIEQYYLHVRARKEFEQAARAHLMRDRMEGRLIPKTLVQEGFAHIDAAHIQLLTDAANTIPTKLRGVKTHEEGKAIVYEVISTILTHQKRRRKRHMAADDPSAALKDPHPLPKRDPHLEAICEGISVAKSKVTAKCGAMADWILADKERGIGFNRTNLLIYLQDTINREFYDAKRQLTQQYEDDDDDE